MSKKLMYVSPKLEVTVVELEEGIAAGSVGVNVGSFNGEVRQEWVEDANDERDIEFGSWYN